MAAIEAVPGSPAASSTLRRPPPVQASIPSPLARDTAADISHLPQPPRGGGDLPPPRRGNRGAAEALLEKETPARGNPSRRSFERHLRPRRVHRVVHVGPRREELLQRGLGSVDQ